MLSHLSFYFPPYLLKSGVGVEEEPLWHACLVSTAGRRPTSREYVIKRKFSVCYSLGCAVSRQTPFPWRGVSVFCHSFFLSYVKTIFFFLNYVGKTTIITDTGFHASYFKALYKHQLKWQGLFQTPNEVNLLVCSPSAESIPHGLFK